MTRRPTQADILDCRARRVMTPDGQLGARLMPDTFIFLELLTQHVGAVVEQEAMAEALWPEADDPIAVRAALYKRARAVRQALASSGWTWNTLYTREDMGWEIDPDEVARGIAEARGE